MYLVKFFLLLSLLAIILVKNAIARMKVKGDKCNSLIDGINSDITIEGVCSSIEDCLEHRSNKRLPHCRPKLICCPEKLRQSEKYCIEANNFMPYDDTEDQIIGGEKAKLEDFPHMVSFGFIDTSNHYQHYCGGSLISDRFVLTSAHCFLLEGKKCNKCESRHFQDVVGDIAKLNIVNLDDSNALDAEIEELFVHPNYSSVLKKNDIALVKLNEVISFKSTVRPACLWQSDQDKESASVCGYGLTVYNDATSASRDLMKVILNIIDQTKCRPVYDPLIKEGLDEAHRCLGVHEGGKDSCLGDSGGPVHYEKPDNRQYDVHYIAGIVSFGKGCALKNKPGVFTTVYPYLDWIEGIVWPTENNITKDISATNNEM